jgi:uncharacterized membrane protein YraQ (UPF0718 family)
MRNTDHLRQSIHKSIQTFFYVLPILLAMLLLTSLITTLFQQQISAGLFGNGNLVDSIIAASIGSLAMGHPLASYILGGELLGSGVSLIAITALLVAWVTVGIAQFPAEVLFLGTRFALFRIIICFIAAIAIAFLTVHTLRLFGLA